MYLKGDNIQTASGQDAGEWERDISLDYVIQRFDREVNLRARSRSVPMPEVSLSAGIPCIWPNRRLLNKLDRKSVV